MAVSASEFESRVLQLVMGAVAPYGFALGGGQGLRAHQIIDRETQDIDGFTGSLEPEFFDSAEKDIFNIRTHVALNLHST
jgi:hypothetical protein